MILHGLNINAIFWWAWSGYWLYSARAVKKTKSSEKLWERLSHLLPLGFCFLMLFSKGWNFLFLNENFWNEADWISYLGNGLNLMGLLFSVWARVHLGKNWSAIVTLKEDHKLITSGPYHFVRNPIYTGILLAMIGDFVCLGKTRGLLAVAIATTAFIRKIKREERFLSTEFGPEFLKYKKSVKALIPFIY